MAGEQHIGTAAIEITADASGFQESLQQQIDEAISKVIIDYSKIRSEGQVPGPSGSTSGGATASHDAGVPAARPLEGSSGGNGTSVGLNLNFEDLRRQIEAALSAPFNITVRVNQEGNTPASQMPAREAPTAGAANPTVHPQATAVIDPHVATALRSSVDLQNGITGFYGKFTTLMREFGQSFGRFDPNSSGNEAGMLQDLVGRLGPNIRDWVKVENNRFGGTAREALAQAGVPAERRRELLTDPGTATLFDPLRTGRNAEGGQTTSGVAFKPAGPTGQPFSAIVRDAPWSAPAQQPMAVERLAPPPVPEQPRAQPAAAPVSGNDREVRAQRRAQAASYAETVKSVTWGRGIDPSTGPDLPSGARPDTGTETLESTPLMLDEERQQLRRERRNIQRREARRAATRGDGAVLPDAVVAAQAAASLRDQARLAEISNRLKGGYGEATNLGPNVTGTGEGRGTSGTMAEARPTFGEGLTAGRDPARARSRGVGATRDRDDAEQITADKLKAQEQLGRGGFRESDKNRYSDADLRFTDQGINIDLTGIVRQAQIAKANDAPWFGLQSGAGGAFQLPLPDTEDPVELRRAMDARAAMARSTQRGTKLPEETGIKEPVVGLSPREAIRRMAMEEFGGGDAASREVVSNFIDRPETRAALNAALSASLPAGAVHVGDDSMRSSSPEQQARLDLQLREAQRQQGLAEARILKYHAMQDDVDPVTGARSGRGEQELIDKRMLRAESDARKYANQVADLQSRGAGAIVSTPEEARHQAALSSRLGQTTRGIVSGGAYTEAYGEGTGRISAQIPGGSIPLMQGADARRTLAQLFGLPSVDYAEGSKQEDINAAERTQMQRAIETNLTKPFLDALMTAEHEAQPDVRGGHTTGTSDPNFIGPFAPTQEKPDAMTEERLTSRWGKGARPGGSLTARVFNDIAGPILDQLDAIPKDDKEGQKFATEVRKQLREFYNDLAGNISTINEMNDEYETTLENDSRRGGGRSISRDTGRGTGSVRAGRFATTAQKRRAAASTFFQQANIPMTSLDEERQDAESRQTAAFKQGHVLERLAAAETKFAETTPANSNADLAALNAVEAEVKAIREAHPAPNVREIRGGVEELIKQVVGELGGSPDNKAVSEAISTRPGVDERVRKEAVEALGISTKTDPTQVYGSLGGQKFVAPPTRDTSLAVPLGDAHRSRRAGDNGVVGEAPANPVDEIGSMFPEAPTFAVSGTPEENAARKAEIAERMQAISDQKSEINKDPGFGDVGRMRHQQWQDLHAEEMKLQEELTQIGRPVETSAGPIAGGRTSTEAGRRTAEQPMNPGIQDAIDRSRGVRPPGGSGGGGGGDGSRQDPVGPGGFGDHGPLRVIVTNVPLAVELAGGGAAAAAQASGATTPQGFAQAEAAYKRAQLEASTSPRNLNYVQTRIDRMKQMDPNRSDESIYRALKEAGQGPAAEALMHDQIAGERAGGGGGGSGGGTIAGLARKYGVSQEIRQISSEERDKNDMLRAKDQATSRVAQEKILSRGFTASATNLLQGRFFAGQQEDVNRFNRESQQLATARDKLVNANENVQHAKNVKETIEKELSDLGTPTTRAGKRQLRELTNDIGKAQREVEVAERDAGHRRDDVAAQQAKADTAKENLPSGRDAARNLAIGGVAAGGAFALGSIVYQVAGMALGALMQGIQMAIGPAIEHLAGDPNVTKDISSNLSQTFSSSGFNRGAIAGVIGQQGISTGAYANIRGPLEERAQQLSGNQALATLGGLQRAEANIGKDASNRALYQSMGGVANSWIGGQAPAAQIIAGQIKDLEANFAGGTLRTPTDTTTGEPLDYSKMTSEQRAMYDDAKITQETDPYEIKRLSTAADQAAKNLDGFNKQVADTGSGLKLVQDISTNQAHLAETTALAERARKQGSPDLAEAIEKSRLYITGGKGGGEDLDRYLKAATNLTVSPELYLESTARQRQAQIWRGEQGRELSLEQISPQFGMEQALNPIGKLLEPLKAMGVSGLGDVSKLLGQVRRESKTGRAEAVDFVTNGSEQLGTIGLGAEAGKEFADALGRAAGYANQISKLQIGVATEQAAYSAHQYAYNIEIANRSLRDAKGLTGQITDAGKDNLGVLERQQFLLQRQSQSLSLELQQRQINFSLATAGLTVPGETPEMRAARIEQAKLEAEYAQKQLNIQKQLFDLGGKTFQITASRSVRDLTRQLGLLSEGRKVELHTAEAEAKIKALTTLQEKENKKVQIYYESAMKRTNDLLDLEADLISSTEVGLQRISNAAIKAFQTEYKGIVDAINNYSEAVDQLYPDRRNDTNPVGPGSIPGASGLLFDTTGETNLTVGEAGHETVAVLKNPRRMSLSDMGPMGTPSKGEGGGTFNATINFNNAHVRKDSDIKDIAREVERILGSRAALLFGRNI